MRERLAWSRTPKWLRQATRAAVALCLGVLVGLAAVKPEALMAVAVIIVLVFVTASLTRPDPLVFAGFLLITMPRLHLPGAPLPLGESVMLLAVASAFLTSRRGQYTMPRWARLCLGAFVVAFFASMVFNGLHEYANVKRMLHLCVFALVIVGLVRGLLPHRAAIRGLTVGLAISVISGIVLLPRSTYAGRLTGFFGDPNVAGLLIVTLGCLALNDIARLRNQVIYAAFLVSALVLTYSRTAILAALMVVLWMVIGRRLRPIGAVAVVLVAAITIGVLPTSLQQVGPFSDRVGSDLLRDRIVSEELGSAREKPVLGHGPGTATVMVNYGTTRFYFHNSYLALVQEGGVISLGLLMALLIGTFLAAVSLARDDRRPLLEAAVIGVWVVAINLGEVLLQLSTAVVIGVVLAYVVRTRARTSSPSVSLAASSK